jgi:hypothetical protein
MTTDPTMRGARAMIRRGFPALALLGASLPCILPSARVHPRDTQGRPYARC